MSPAEFVTPRAILTGHDCEITCAAVCAELGLVISGSKGECLRRAANPAKAPAEGRDP